MTDPTSPPFDIAAVLVALRADLDLYKQIVASKNAKIDGLEQEIRDLNDAMSEQAMRIAKMQRELTGGGR